ncbi:MAG: hypothetical protein H6739_08815 [Alphaproteobacteria bacterium]|nr:hypothetical protein [Alphaproteobacteria bacterium]
MGYLKDIRMRLGFSEDEVAGRLSLSRRAYRALEEQPHDDLEFDTLLELRDVLGLDINSLLEASFPERFPIAALLKSSAETLPLESRLALAAATSVGRDFKYLKVCLDPDQPGTAWEWLKTFEHDDDYSHPREGAPERLARLARERLGLSADEPIPSIFKLLRGRGILFLEDEHVPELDAFSMVAEGVAPLIMSNLYGGHMATAVERRVAWAHELCHLMFDRPMMLDAKRLCVHEASSRLRGRSLWDDVERRARAFAVYLLAPREGVTRIWRRGGEETTRIRGVMEHFGIGYQATRGQLDNLGLLSMRRKVGYVDPMLPLWDSKEVTPQLGDAGAPGLPPMRVLRDLGVPDLRCGVFAQEVLSTWQRHRGEVTQGQIAGLLRVPNGLLQVHYLRDLRS